MQKHFTNTFFIKIILGSVIFSFFLIIPLFFGGYIIQVLLFVFITAYLCGAWNIAGGYGGLLSFGHAAFVGIGGYMTAVLLVYYGISGLIGMLLGGILASLLGCLLAWTICRFRVKGFYFAVATVLMGETLGLVVRRTQYLGRGMGITFPAVHNPLNLQFMGVIPYYYLSLLLVCLIIIIAYKIEKVKLGWYLRASRQGEEAASALGINITRVKVLSMTLSSFLTGFGGGFYVICLRYCSPYDVFGMMFSVTLMLGTLLGGRGTVFGPIVGIFMLTAVKEGLTFVAELEGGTSSYALVLVVWGVILCLIAKYLPNGLVPWIRGLYIKNNV